MSREDSDSTEQLMREEDILKSTGLDIREKSRRQHCGKAIDDCSRGIHLIAGLPSIRRRRWDRICGPASLAVATRVES